MYILSRPEPVMEGRSPAPSAPPPGRPRGAAFGAPAFGLAFLLLAFLLAFAGTQSVRAAALAGGRFVEADGWKARITVDCLLRDKVCGSFRYETLACEGDLVYSGETATGFAFRTELRAGRCLPGCTIEVSADFRRYAEVCRDSSRHEGVLAAAPAPGTVATVTAPALSATPVGSTVPPPLPAAASAAKPAAPPQPAKLNGIVAFKWPNGDAYDGMWVDGKRSGRGRFVWASGQTYDGDWRDDVAVGDGAMTFPNGDRYQGQVRDGMPHGRGRMQFASGDRYEGAFDRGVLDGDGVYTEKDGSRYSGQMKAGVKHGRGKLAWATGQSFDGEWVADKPEGAGKLVFANGDRYEGTVADGLPQGKGVKVFASGDRYEGDFVRGEASGRGTYAWTNGDTYVGEWMKGRKAGPGRYRWASGDYWEGEFADDKRTEVGQLHFTPAVSATGAEGARLAMEADAVAEGARAPRAGTPGMDRTRLLAIPMVAKEVRDCSRKRGGDCADRVIGDVMSAKLQQHRWQTMASEKGAKGKASVFEVDANSVIDGGNVFSWLRSGDGSTARNIGIKYDCRAQTLEIQLIYQCTANQPCVLDPNIEKYAGKVLPATDIRGWFKEACER